MFTVDFYNFKKQENSTARPASGATTFQCDIKRGSAIISPVLELDIGLTEAPSWNYCYIPNFGRYYYVMEWRFDQALWIATLRVDILATYKEDIGNESLYALRAANLYDGNLIDTLYPAKVGGTFQRVDITNPFTDLYHGTFVIGVVGNSPEFGSLNYFALTHAGMNTLISWLLNDSITTNTGFNVKDASFQLQKNIIDPLQYIKSAVYIPIRFSLVIGVPSSSVPVFDWNVPMGDLANAKKIEKAAPVYNWAGGSVDIPKHPQTSTRGNFVNSAPFTMGQFVFPPFGVVEVDTSVTANASAISWGCKIDLPTGLGILTTKANGIILNRLEAQIGVPVQLTQITRDYLGAGLAVVNGAAGVAGGVGQALTGNIAGGVANAINSAANATVSAIVAKTPRSQSIGSGGSYAQLTLADMGLEMQFFNIADDDVTKNGRPLNQIIQPKNVGGYMIIQDGDVPINGTKEEAQELKGTLEGGFYYE